MTKTHTHSTNKAKTMRKHLLPCGMLALCLAGVGPAQAAGADEAAQNGPQESHGWSVDGYARAGFYHNSYGTLLHSRKAYSFGGAVAATSPSYNGFSFGAALYTAQPLGLNSDDASHIAPAMPSDSLTVLGKAYIRFQKAGLDIKVGRQALQTPLVRSTDLRMIPLLYSGATVAWQTPVEGLTLHANRIVKFKPYNDDFYRGDSGTRTDPFLTNPAATTPSVDTAGFATFGLEYKRGGTSTELWYYDLYDRVQAAYGEFNLRLNTQVWGQKPFLGLQYLHEWSGSDVDEHYRQMDSDLYGIKAGFGNRANTFFLAYTFSPENDHASRGGGIVSPYQRAGYNQAPTFTIHPLMGYVTKEQPGRGIGIRDIIHIKKWTVVMGYTKMKYFDAIDLDGTRMPKIDANGRFLVAKYRPTPNNSLKLTFSHTDTGTPIPGEVVGVRFFYTYTFGN